MAEGSETRITHRNGYRPRLWETRVGEIELAIPRKRSGPAYFPSFLEPRRRSEQAIVVVVLEAYVNGVSTRKVDRLVEQLGIAGMDKDCVSRLCRALDEQVEVFRTRPLEGEYPYLWLDAKHVKVRDHGRVVSKALVIAYAVHDSGRREVIGLDLGEVESEAFWLEFLRSLKARGLEGVRLVVSDHHEGLKSAIARTVQRAVAALHRALRAQHAAALPPVPARPGRRRPQGGLQRREHPGRARARDRGHRAARADRAEGRPAARRRRRGPAGLLRLPRRPLEQAAIHEPAGARNREIGRRSDVVGIFPNDAAVIRLLRRAAHRTE
jgi:putative transposase